MLVFPGRKVSITVTLGAHNIRKKELSQQIFYIGHWVIHLKYSEDTLKNHLMLLKLEPKARLSKEVTYILLPSCNEHVKPGTICTVAGWGGTWMTRANTSVLMEVNLKVQRNKVCEKSFKELYLHWSMICIGNKDGKKSTFRGDSGGPLVCNGKAHGIVLHGLKYCIFPKVLTTVSSFEPWMCEELRKFVLQELLLSPSSD